MKVPNLTATKERQARALEEAHTAVQRADPTTPEWVRCMGALWEAFEPHSDLQGDYRELLLEMLTTDPRAPAWCRDDPKKMVSRRLDDLEVVVRQLRERSYFRAAAFAAEVCVEVFPNESFVFSVAANCARQAGDPERAAERDRRCAELLEAENSPAAMQVWARYVSALLSFQPPADAEALALGLAKCEVSEETAAIIVAARRDQVPEPDVELWLQVGRLQRMMPSDPEGAVAEAFSLFEELAVEPGDLSETDEGHELVEFLLVALLAQKDARAIRVGETMLDAKLKAWGEGPATWLERQNLGGIYGELGELAKGRALIRDARARLVDEFGPGHPHVEMCDRNLARLETFARSV